jgi:hypothetical protein
MLIVGSLVDWLIIGILAVPFVAVLLAMGVGEVRRERRQEREAAKLRHPSAYRPNAEPKDVPKAA